ncbi:MAG: hypothetical protein R3F17_11960 [Planctomycetota bacterium]
MSAPSPGLRSAAAAPFGARTFLLWTLVLLLVKGSLIATLADIQFYGEEPEKGSVAKAMIDGIGVDFHRLAYHYYEGGGFFISAVKALAFQLVGESMLAQRLVGLLTCWLVFAALWRFLRFHAGASAAHLGALLFLFGPSGFQRYSMLTLGIHFEGLALGLPLLDEGLRLLRFRNWNPSGRRTLAVGALAGFALFFSYQNALILGWVGLGVLVLRPRWLFSRGALPLVPGFLLGGLPLWIMLALVGKAMVDIHGTELAQLTSTSEKLRSYLGSLFQGVSPWTLVQRSAYPLLLLATAALWLRRRTAAFAAQAWLAGFVGLWLLAWYKGPFLADHHVHYFAWLRWAPPTVVLLVWAAWVLAERWRTAAAVVGPLAGIAVLLGLGAFGQILAQAQWRTPMRNLDRLAHWKGYNYRGHFRTLLTHLPDASIENLRPLLEFDEPDPELLWTDIATAAVAFQPNAHDAEGWMLWLQQLPAEGASTEMKTAFARGMGPALMHGFGGDVNAALQALQKSHSQWKDEWIRAVGFYGSGWALTPESIQQEFETIDSGNRTSEYLWGLGARVFRNCVVSPYGGALVLNPERAEFFLDEFPEACRFDLRKGFEHQRALWRLVNNSAKTPL